MYGAALVGNQKKPSTSEPIGTVDDFNHRDLENAAALQRKALDKIQAAKSPQDLRSAAFVVRAAQDTWRIAVGLAKQVDFSKFSDAELEWFIAANGVLASPCRVELSTRQGCDRGAGEEKGDELPDARSGDTQ